MKFVGDSHLCKSHGLHTQTPGQRLVLVHSVLWQPRRRLAGSGHSTGNRGHTHFASWAPASPETNSQPPASYRTDTLLFVNAMIQFLTDDALNTFCFANLTDLKARTKSPDGISMQDPSNTHFPCCLTLLKIKVPVIL